MPFKYVKMSFSFKVQVEEMVQRGGRGGKEKTRKEEKKRIGSFKQLLEFNSRLQCKGENHQTE